MSEVNFSQNNDDNEEIHNNEGLDERKRNDKSEIDEKLKSFNLEFAETLENEQRDSFQDNSDETSNKKPNQDAKLFEVIETSEDFSIIRIPELSQSDRHIRSKSEIKDEKLQIIYGEESISQKEKKQFPDNDDSTDVLRVSAEISKSSVGEETFYSSFTFPGEDTNNDSDIDNLDNSSLIIEDETPDSNADSEELDFTPAGSDHTLAC